MSNLMKRFWHDESGPEMVEWAVVTVILLATTTILVIHLRVALIDMFGRIYGSLQAVPPENY